jgi:hypothetical protein
LARSYNSAKTFTITILSIMTLSEVKFIKMTLSIKTFSVMILSKVTFGIMTHHNYTT